MDEPPWEGLQSFLNIIFWPRRSCRSCAASSSKFLYDPCNWLVRWFSKPCDWFINKFSRLGNADNCNITHRSHMRLKNSPSSRIYCLPDYCNWSRVLHLCEIQPFWMWTPHFSAKYILKFFSSSVRDVENYKFS